MSWTAVEWIQPTDNGPMLTADIPAGLVATVWTDDYPDDDEVDSLLAALSPGKSDLTVTEAADGSTTIVPAAELRSWLASLLPVDGLLVSSAEATGVAWFPFRDYWVTVLDALGTSQMLGDLSREQQCHIAAAWDREVLAAGDVCFALDRWMPDCDWRRPPP
ncbi:hypothetical protein ACK8HX_00010 [Oryzobacter sp. R7]|uniref:hypothetical protein n=1 Tax=Oryzobacter faecalis TaxID=3388656 RepID=UPI00398D620B